jgi:4-hydroxythreonine-4-phosphate dehydrogenase
LKTIAITLGDVAGIGPEVLRKSLHSGKLDRHFRYEVVMEGLAPRVRPGKPSVEASSFALRSLEIGVRGCMGGRYAALVTGPVSKAGLKSVGFRFPGQTEFLAHQTQAKNFAMMLVGGPLRITLVTIHVPLRKVSSLLTLAKISNAISLTHEWLKKFGIQKARIMVAGLNPHGGVESESGEEEKRIIGPAIRKAQRKFGKGITGPHSPDIVFWNASKGEADAVVCMYHDQGLIPLKMLAFDRGVNLTLGLPIIRTSPDHGTAYDIAGKDKANPQSMIEAIKLAAQLARSS